MSFKLIILFYFGVFSIDYGGPLVKVESTSETEKLLTFYVDSNELDSASKVFMKLTECLSEYEFIVTGNYNSAENKLELTVKDGFKIKEYLKCVTVFNTRIKSPSQFIE